MISENSPTQSADSVSNPQQVSGDNGASDSASFQQSAGQDVLSQSHSLSVEQTGQPIDVKPISTSSAAFMWLLAVIVTVVLIAGAAIVYKWIIKRPVLAEELLETISPVKVPKKTTVKSAPKKPTKSKAKKKQSRSKRKK